MFSRRLFIALAACLVLSSSTAFAGGGGTKKNSTIRVINNGANPIYAFVDVAADRIEAAADQADPIAAFKALGGKQIASGGNAVNFAVKAGAHKVTAVDLVTQTAVAIDKPVTTTKGKTSRVEIP